MDSYYTVRSVITNISQTPSLSAESLGRNGPLSRGQGRRDVQQDALVKHESPRDFFFLPLLSFFSRGREGPLKFTGWARGPGGVGDDRA